MSTSNRIDADDTARLDAHAEHAALECNMEPADAPEHEWLDWDAENTRYVAIAVPFPAPDEEIARGRAPRLQSIIEVRLWLGVDGSACVQVHRSIDGDENGDCEPYFPESNEIATARARKLGSYAIHLDKGEPVLQGGMDMVKSLAEALTKAAAIAARYKSEWQRHYDALRAQGGAP